MRELSYYVDRYKKSYPKKDVEEAYNVTKILEDNIPGGEYSEDMIVPEQIISGLISTVARIRSKDNHAFGTIEAVVVDKSGFSRDWRTYFSAPSNDPWSTVEVHGASAEDERLAEKINNILKNRDRR